MWRLLVIDDDEVDREAVRRVFEASGHPVAVREATDGASGLAAIEDGQIDCVLLDFRLPDLDGLDFLERIRDDRDLIPFPVLMMTGEGSEEIAVQAMKRGATDYMVKDKRWPAKTLVERTRRAIEHWALVEEKKRADEALASSHAQLEQFAFAASHDLQEPLRMVTMYLQLLERQYREHLDDTAGEYIAFAVDGAQRMRDMIRDLLELSRVTRLGDAITAVDMGRVVETVRRDLEARLEETGGSLVVATLPEVMADEIQMVRLCENLVTNALKYSRDDRSPEIHVSARRTGRVWEFSVRDNGIGIDPAYRDKIFMIFQRLHGRDQYDGTGIGLAMCKRIVEHHKGRIWVEPAPDGGSLFRFTLPIAE